MNKPSRWIALVTWFPMLIWGVWLDARRSYAWDMVISITVIEASALLLLFWLIVTDLIWKAYLGQLDTTQVLGSTTVRTPVPVNVDGKPHGEMIYTQITTAPRFDMERHMAVVIVRALDDGQSPDFRETTWVNKDKTNRFPTRAAFVSVIDKWKRLQAIARQSPDRANSSYIVTDPRVIRLIAGGEKFQ